MGRNHKWVFLFLCALLLSPAAWGKTENQAGDLMAKIDSLEQIREYDEACRLTALFLAQYGSQHHTDPVLTVRAYLKKSICIRTEGKNHESIPFIEKALEMALELSDSGLTALCYRELGFSNVITGNYQQGLYAYTSALAIDKELEDLVNVSLSLNAIGKINEMWREFETALDFFYQSLEVSQKLNNLNQVAIRKASIASVYKSQQKFEKALEYLEKSLALEIELNNEVRKGYRLDQMGEIYTTLEEFQKAEQFLFEALTIFKDHRILVSQSIALNHIALNYMMQNKLDEAMLYYDQSLAIAQETGFNNMIQKNYEELSRLKEKRGDFEKALTYYKHFIILRDSAYNKQAKQQLLDFQVRYETEQKEKELAILNKEKLEKELQLNKARQQHIFMASMLLVLLVSLGALYSRFYIKKQAQAKLSAAYRQLSTLNQTKNKFFTILAHDLKNPIYAFRNISTAMHDNFSDLNRSEMQNFSGELKHTAEKLCTFLEELLKWAASLTGRLAPKSEHVELATLFSELTQLHQPMIAEKNLNLSLKIPDNHVVWADRNMVQTVFRNILINAFKFTPEQGWIKVETKMNNNQISIKISDSGPGIAPEDTARLFNLGNDPSKIGNSKEKGMGLGLVLCKEFVDKNQGHIWAESRPGEGAIFHIVFPTKSEN